MYYRHCKLTVPGAPTYRATIAYEEDEEVGYYLYGLAICSPSDQFCKKTGRDLASSRLSRVRERHPVGWSVDEYCGVAELSGTEMLAEIFLDNLYSLPEKLQKIVRKKLSRAMTYDPWDDEVSWT